MSAVVAPFTARVPAIPANQGSAMPCRLVFQLAQELAPSRLGDRFGKAAVFLHVTDSKALHGDPLVLANDPTCERVEKIGTRIRYAHLDAGHLEPCLGPVGRPFLFFGGPPLDTVTVATLALSGASADQTMAKGSALFAKVRVFPSRLKAV